MRAELCPAQSSLEALSTLQPIPAQAADPQGGEFLIWVPFHSH